jgi:hypothetical protein
MPATINGTSGFGGNLTGNVTGNADTATTAGKFSTTSGDAPTYACRAWVNFDATRDASGASNTSNTNRFLRGSGNVASVLRNGAGDYTITFTTGMPDAGYALCATVSQTGTSSNAFIVYELHSAFRSTTQVRIAVGNNESDVFSDATHGVSVSIFR